MCSSAAEALTDPSWMSSPVGWMGPLGSDFVQATFPPTPPSPVAIAHSCQLPPAVWWGSCWCSARPSPLMRKPAPSRLKPGFPQSPGAAGGGRAGAAGRWKPPVPAREGRRPCGGSGFQDGRVVTARGWGDRRSSRALTGLIFTATPEGKLGLRAAEARAVKGGDAFEPRREQGSPSAFPKKPPSLP